MKIIVNETQYNKLLMEQRGFSKVAEDWARIVTDRVMEDIFTIESEDVITMGKLSSKYGDESFFRKLPLESILIILKVNWVDGDEGGGDAGYVPNWSHLEDDVVDGLIVMEDVEFSIDIDIPNTATKEEDHDSIKDYIFQMLSHELLHVYEWYQRGLEDPAERTDCMDIFSSGDLHGNVVEKLAYLIYTQLSFEMNAFTHQAGTMLRGRNITSYEEFMEELHSLFIWDFVEAMLEFDANDALNEVEKLDEKYKDLLNTMKMCYYSTKDEYGEMEINPKSVGYSNERFLTDLGRKFKVRGTAMKRKLHKMAPDVINEGESINEQLENITATGEKVSVFDTKLGGNIIRRWSKNNKEHVEIIQRMLVYLGYDIGNYGPNGDGVDGKYGKYTEQGVKDFQEEVMPEDPNQWDGVMGPITFQHLKDQFDEKAEDEGVEVDELLTPIKDDNLEMSSDISVVDGEMITSISGDIDIKKGQLFQAGPISAVWELILNDLDDKLDNAGIKYKITAGNDNSHIGKNSRHAIGCAVDWAVRPRVKKNKFNKKYVVRVYDIMDELVSVYGDKYGFSWLDEYNRETGGSTGTHIHMSISREFCGGKPGKEITTTQTLPKDAIV